jgi:hypothetical protein
MKKTRGHDRPVKGTTRPATSVDGAGHEGRDGPIDQEDPKVKRMRRVTLVGLMGVGATLFATGCPVTGLVGDCFSENSISRAEYEDLNDFEQLLYEENWCGRYEPVSDILNPFL